MANQKITNSVKKSYHHGDLYQQLLDTAALMIKEQGESALSMRKLADRVGVSRTAAYHHFRDKRDLLCAVAEEGFRRFMLLGDQLSGVDDLDTYLHQYVRGYVMFAVENSEYYDLMFSGHIWKSESLTGSLTQRSHNSFRAYVDKMTILCAAKSLPQGVTPLRFAQVTWSTLHGLSRLMIDGIYVEQTAIDSICDASARVLMQNVVKA